MEVKRGVVLDAAGPCELPLLEAFFAEDRATLGWPERHGGVFAARRAARLGFDAVARRGRPCAHAVRALGLAPLAPLRFVFELLVREEQLLARRPDEISTA